MMSAASRISSSSQANGPVRWAVAFAAGPLACLLLAPNTSAAANITIEHPWMRLIIKSRPAAGYFTLHNDADLPVELTGASSSGCGSVMLHQSKEVNRVENMLPVEEVTVPAHGTVSFTPGGYHLMCMQPQNSMVVGQQVPLTVKFADGKTVTADFSVKGPGG